MVMALRRAKLLDTSVVACLLILLSVMHYALLQSGRSRSFVHQGREHAYKGLLIASWPILSIGAAPLLFFWCVGRSTDRAHFSSATSTQLLVVMLASLLVAVGCVLLAVGEALWVADIGFQSFRLVMLLGILAFVLLIWIAVQVLMVVREAAAVRKHLRDNPQGSPPGPDDFDIQSDSELPHTKDDPFS